MGKAPKPSRNTRLSQVADLKPLQGLTSLERLDLDGAKAVYQPQAPRKPDEPATA